MMKAIVNTNIISAPAEDAVVLRIRRWHKVSGISFLAGTMVGLAALMLSVLSALRVLSDAPIATRAEPALIVAALVLLIFGAHGIDRIQELRISIFNEGP